MPDMKLVSRLALGSYILDKFINEANLDKFINEANLDIDELNKLIGVYNGTTTHNEGIEQLKKIFRFKQSLENKYSDNYLSRCPAFSIAMQVELFAAIQTELAQCGITNLHGILDTTASPPLPQNHFSEILSNMSPQKVNLLIQILLEDSFFNINLRFADLYKPDENGYVEFNNFLKKNSLSFLGGYNSRNFKIQPNDGSSPYVLKVENRFGMSKLPVVHLQESVLKDKLAPVMAARQSTCIVNKKHETRTVLVTEFYAHSDLMTYGQQYKSDDAKRVKTAFDIYSQMLDILMALDKEGCAFADMKNENWLIDSNGILTIADTKSVIFFRKDGLIDFRIHDGNFGSFVLSLFLAPPEVVKWGPPISADKMHVFMLGKNLYQYLTNCDNEYLYDRDDIEQLNFSSPIFKTESGEKLEQLIKKMIISVPDARISLESAKAQLNLIIDESKKERALDFINTEGLRLLDKIKSLDLDANEYSKLKQRITDLMQSIAGDLASLKEAKHQLIQIDNQLKDDKTLNLLKKEGLKLLDTVKLLGLETNERQKLEESITNIIQPDPANSLLPKEAKHLLAQIDADLKKKEKEFIKTEGLRLLNKIKSFDLSALALTAFKCAIDVWMEPHCDHASLGEIRRQLNLIDVGITEEELKSLKEKAKMLLDKISLHGFGEKDAGMVAFTQQVRDKLSHFCEPEQVRQIILKLETTLNQQKIADEIKQITQKFRNKASRFTIGMQEKANKIEMALCAIPVEDRGKIFDNEYKKGLDVQLAIASHRLFPFFQSVKVEKGKIVEKTAAKSYTMFKDRLQKMKSYNKDEQTKETLTAK